MSKAKQVPPKSLLGHSQKPSSEASPRPTEEVSLITKTGSEDAIQVVVRFRPLNETEMSIDSTTPLVCRSINPYKVQIGDSEYCTFNFDHIFYSNAAQVDIFKCVGEPIVEDVLMGYNGTVLAYGQTGSGKTFSMMGVLDDPVNSGLIPRSAAQIFEAILKADPGTVFTIKCSMMEIYKETLKDLLYPSDQKLKIKKTIEGITVEGLTEEYVASEDELLERIAYGQENRTTACTKMNSRSSRSHQLFIIKVRQQMEDGLEKTGTLNLVDLAGSEKINSSGVTGTGLEEAKKINLSLSMLGHVIQKLSLGSSHIPYRDSKLTRILQESLGGNFKTRLLVACSPHIRNIEETISTLKFAQRAKTVKTKAVMNVKEAPDVIIARLTKQLEEAYAYIEELKKLLGGKKVAGPVGAAEIARMVSMPEEGGEAEDQQISPITPNRSLPYPIGLDRWKSSIEMVTETDELSPVSLHISEQDSSRFEDIQRSWEMLRLQHLREKAKLDQQINDLNTENLRQKFKTQEYKRKNQELERFIMNYIEKTEIDRKSQVSQIVLNRKDEEIALLKSEIRGLTQRLLDSDSRVRESIEEKRTDWIEMEEVISCDSSFATETFCDVNRTTSNTIVHTLPLDTDFVTSVSLLDTKDPSFHLSNQMSQMSLINFKANRALEAKNWRFFLMQHQYEIAQLKIATLTDKQTESENLMSFLFAACKEAISRGPVRQNFTTDDFPRPKVAKPLSGRSLARHNTVRQPPSWNPQHDIKRSVARVERGMAIRGVIMEEDSAESELNMPSKTLLKTISTNARSLDKRVQTMMQQYKLHEDKLQVVEKQIYASHKREMTQWNRILTEVKDNYERELGRKQEEMLRLNSTLAMWVNQYIDLQQRIVHPKALKLGEEDSTAPTVHTERLRKTAKLMAQVGTKEVKPQAAKPTMQVLYEPMCGIERLHGDESINYFEDDD